MRYHVLTSSSSIVRLRKRKLRELYALATEEDGILNLDFANPDAPPTTAAEEKFLAEADILQYVFFFFLWAIDFLQPCYRVYACVLFLK